MSADAKDVEAMSIKELKALITSAGLSTKDCVEKADLRRRAVEAQARLAAGEWATVPLAQRTPVLARMADLLDDELEDHAAHIVREMGTGKSYAFAKKGDYELKGFEEPIPIFLVEWQAGAAVPGEAA